MRLQLIAKLWVHVIRVFGTGLLVVAKNFINQMAKSIHLIPPNSLDTLSITLN